MDNNNYCCSKDAHGLKYPGFSVVLLQVFAIDAGKNFKPDDALKMGFMGEVENGIDRLIFNICGNDENGGIKNDEKSIKRYELDGFDFSLSLKKPFEVTLSGHVKVRMSVFFGNTVSISYRFVFDQDGEFCKMSKPVVTDHIIALLSIHFSAEHWSRNKDQSETDINTEITDFVISELKLDGDGNFLYEKSESVTLNAVGRVFDQISVRYKKYVKNHCAVENKKEADYRRLCAKNVCSPANDPMDDFHYAMVDIWENVRHPVKEEGRRGKDLFAKSRIPKLSEADIISHIKDYHKPELMGLMTMYPEEWIYRDPAAYDEVCGENIAIDTDDLVLANHNVCVVIGTYGRRGEGSPVNWQEHLRERSKYHVSWPEYLLILEMVLAKKYVIGYAKDQLIDATLGLEKVSSYDLIARNAALGIKLSRMILQLDVVKYSRFMSHKVMFDRMTRRLELDKDIEILNGLMSVVDNSLHNLSDYKAMKSDFILNFILALISMASTFELLFQQSEMPFLTYFGIANSGFAAILVWVVATVTFFGILLVFANMLKKVFERL